MKLLYFPGCKIPFHLPAYDRSTRSVLSALEVELVDMDLNCCGYPVRHQDFSAFLLSATRDLALAEAQGLDILTPCKCCFGSFKHALYWLRRRPALRDRINSHLAAENLHWSDRSDVIHLLSLLYHKVGTHRLQDHVRTPLEHLKVAAHYGCHALRPVEVTGFDNPTAPQLFEALVAVTGATPVFWARRTECCGNPLWSKNQRLALALMEKKLASAQEAGAEMLCSACTYCQLQFDEIRRQHPHADPTQGRLQAILFPQLLGLSMDLPAENLGLDPRTLTGACAFTVEAGK